MENTQGRNPFADLVVKSSIKEEMDKRLDLRNECIFTIDPSTARVRDTYQHLIQLKNLSRFFRISMMLFTASNCQMVNLI